MDELQKMDLKDPNMSFMQGCKLPRHVRNLHISEKYATESKTQATNLLHTLTANFQFTREMRQEADKFFEEALRNEYFYSWGTTRKLVAAVCVYLILARERAITVHEVCNAVGVDIHTFTSAYFKYLGTFGSTRRIKKSLEDLVDAVLKDVSFEESERKEISLKTVKIVQLMAQMETIDGAIDMEGKSPVRLIVAAAYLAWQTLNLKVRKLVKFTQFYETHDLDKSQANVVRNRIADIRKNLILLTTKWPWLRDKSFEKKNVVLFLDELLEAGEDLIIELKCQTLANHYTSDSKPNIIIHRIPDFKPDEETDLPISDEEISSYLRSDQEVEKLSQLKRMLEINNAEEESQRKKSAPESQKSKTAKKRGRPAKKAIAVVE